MCGFAGFFQPNNGRSTQEMIALATTMNRAIAHRGPDGAGAWADADAGFAVGHRRLAILELSEAGAQPMASATGRYVIAYNGEIYNHREMRAALERLNGGTQWRGSSDTETLLRAIEVHGLEQALGQAIGMFAFALWDRQTRTLSLVRDRMGEKPLYYGWNGKGSERAFLFGSDLLALRSHPSFDDEIDRSAVMLLATHGYIPAPYSIHTSVRKLPPGSILTIAGDDDVGRIDPYWEFDAIVDAGLRDRFAGSPLEAVERVKVLLTRAVGRQLIADVPLGAFLSGGIDSSTIVAVMQEQSAKPVKTFTIGFEEEGFDEAQHARQVAEHLGTDHCELYVTADDALAVIPQLPFQFSEPFADSSQIPTFLVSRLARESVTVSLSGDGGDELFGGYERYRLAARTWNGLRRFPLPMRTLAGMAIHAIPTANLDWLGTRIGGPRLARLGDRAHKAAGLLGSRTLECLYEGLISHCPRGQSGVVDAPQIGQFAGHHAPDAARHDAALMMMALDSVHYLPDDILVKVDRAAMALSLETRVPMLDHELVSFAWSLPADYRIRAGVTKWPLRQVLGQYVPDTLFDRPKMGFGIPIGQWLRGPLRDWAETLLDHRRLEREGYFDAGLIAQLWKDHLSERRNWAYRLWNILMFQAWLSELPRTSKNIDSIALEPAMSGMY